ncbi:hypothetical protein FACS1894174_04770 [Bacteroidia bacterium]|nr:hypothetical protein FACS1894155_04460 [Bacteroidia bacterium]GHV21409.1 hypothetical protein FACS1894174_04770 [Bacteroidia bacterium]
METKLTEQQSFELISEMITQARNNLQKNSGTAMIYNGLLVAFVALANVALVFILSNPVQSYWIWLLMIPGAFIDRMIDKKIDKENLVKTHIDKIVSATWRGFGYSVILFLIIIFGYGYSMQNPRIFILITPMIMLMTGFAEYITAKACRFKPFLYGAFIMWTGTLSCLGTYLFLNYWAGIAHFFILAICMILAFVIPGYKLNKLAK